MKNKIAQEMFGVDYDQLGLFGKWEVEDKLKINIKWKIKK